MLQKRRAGERMREALLCKFLLFSVGGFACGMCMLVAGEDQRGEE